MIFIQYYIFNINKFLFSKQIQQFPPFYCQQPNQQLKEKYINKWIEIITDFCYKQNKNIIKRNDQIFQNKALNLQAETRLIDDIFMTLVQNNQAKIIDSQQIQLTLVNDTQGKNILVEQLKEQGLNNETFTIQEIQQALQNSLIQGYSEEKIMQWLYQLQKEKSCTVIKEQDQVLGVSLYL